MADFISAFIREVNNLWPGKLSSDYQPTDWDWSDALTGDEIDAVWKVIRKKPNFWMTLRPCFDNVHAIATHRLRHPDDEIFYVTARVSTSGMGVMQQTQLWLQECGIGGVGTSVIVDHSGDKCPIFNALECEANIDDRLSSVIEHSKNTSGAYLLDRSWNRVSRPAGLRVVGSLQEFFAATRSKNAKAS